METEAQTRVAQYFYDLAQAHIQDPRVDGADGAVLKEHGYALEDFSDYILTRETGDRRPAVLLDLTEFAPGPRLRSMISSIRSDSGLGYDVLFTDLLLAALEDAGQSMAQIFKPDGLQSQLSERRRSIG